ncbi:unnamed protein product [Pieris brassicae]|uniref:Uncharacterized protein n=1 Tax=Pieris brassicae TaxID=7116 RepID=A0A9P0XFL2_PIEBR|nr:unnamed protein product [Pieris brassicae]
MPQKSYFSQVTFYTPIDRLLSRASHELARAPVPTSSDQELAQCETFAISNSQKESLDLIFTDFEMVGSCIENIENQDINNLPCMNMINNQLIMSDNNCDLMNISTSELINISSNNLISTENNSRAIPQPEPPVDVSLNEMNKKLNITLRPTPDVYTCNVAEKHNSQFDGIAITCPTSDETFNDNLISVDQSNIIVPANEHTISTLSANHIRNNKNEPEHHGDLATNKKRRSTVNKDTRKWKRIVNRDLRMKGEEYLGYRREKKKTIKKAKYTMMSLSQPDP